MITAFSRMLAITQHHDLPSLLIHYKEYMHAIFISEWLQQWCRQFIIIHSMLPANKQAPIIKTEGS